MVKHDEINAQVERVLELARQKFGVRASSLEAARRKIGRRMPERLHHQVSLLSEAQALGQHPKLMMRVDSRGVARAFREVEAYLLAVDVRARRVDRLLDVMGTVSFNLLLFVVCLLMFLRWQGLV